MARSKLYSIPYDNERNGNIFSFDSSARSDARTDKKNGTRKFKSLLIGAG